MCPSKLNIEEKGKLSVTIREFHKETDTEHVQELERRCDLAIEPVEPGKTSLIFTNLDHADPLCRVRSYPIYCMMVAEIQLITNVDDSRIVGIIRAGIKQVIRPVLHTSKSNDNIRPGTAATYITAMYISGLRVCCLYRRLGVAQQLVNAVEAWGTKHGAEYAYMATENDNQASINLFVHKLGYKKFRTPSLLVQPVYGKPMLVRNAGFGHRASRNGNNTIQIIKLSPVEAGRLYRKTLRGMEFFPMDIDSVLRNPLNVGTWLACYKNDVYLNGEEKRLNLENRDGIADVEDRCGGILGTMFKRVEEGSISWAILSLWRYDKLIKFELRGASKRMRRWAALTRLASRLVPWAACPCLPNVFDKAFGVQLMYGMHAYDVYSRKCTAAMNVRKSESTVSSLEHHYGRDKCDKGQAVLMESLCWHAHNLALQAGCKAVVAEMSSCNQLKASIPHWPSLSDQDLWCLKRLSVQLPSELDPQGQLEDWCKWPPFASLFHDPRDF